MSIPLFYQCVVLDNDDPLMLERVRARLLTDNYLDIIKSITDPPWDEEKDKWTSRDPFIFNPLLPYFLYQVPKVEELIYIMYYNPDFKYQNQFYVQAMYSSPTLSSFEYYVGAQKFTGLGVQYQNPRPIKNQDGTYASPFPKGVFPEPTHNALLGRNSADIIVKENEVLIRAGKILGNLQPNIIPKASNNRAFLQLSRFDNIKQLEKIDNYSSLVEQVLMTKYLIEWNIINPENSQDKFTGSVYLYKLKPDKSVNTEQLQVDSKIESLKTLVHKSDFFGLSMVETTQFINNFINMYNDKNVIDGKTIFVNTDQKFPVFYRPSNLTYKKMASVPNTTNENSPESIASVNLQKMFNDIKLNYSCPCKGFGLIYEKNKVGKPYDIVKEKVKKFKYTNQPVTFAGLGGEKVFIVSQNSSIPGKKPINFDNTIYGINNDKVVDELIPNTSSMVRGEELLELINLIVRFLVSHTHAYPGLAPLPITEDGTQVNDILFELQNAVNKILNENIRLN